MYENATPAQLRQTRQRLGDFGVSLSVLDTAIYKITLAATAFLSYFAAAGAISAVFRVRPTVQHNSRKLLRRSRRCRAKTPR
jgi:hypothetical protein